jgi:hypothetical protein
VFPSKEGKEKQNSPIQVFFVAQDNNNNKKLKVNRIPWVINKQGLYILGMGERKQPSLRA